MNILQPTPLPFDRRELLAKPFAERNKMLCGAWALQGYGTPTAAYVFYVLKLGLYVGAWLFFCGFTPGLGGLSNIEQWWLHPIAFQKAILWSMLFEGLGLGCGSGPLTGRYAPPVGGFLYFLRPKTTKLPLFPRMPLLGGELRTWLDVALYAALCVALIVALTSAAIDQRLLWLIALLVPVLGLCDRTIFLACRAEHYWTTIVCFVLAGNWFAGAKAVQVALWFWAGFSKLNHHFPMVVCVMASNSPCTRFAWLRRRMYRAYPDDLRPSRIAVLISHTGTALEIGVGLLMLSAPSGDLLVVAMILMLLLHLFITSNVPMGVPIEWNAMVAYGAFALFWAHPEVTVFDVDSLLLTAFLLLMLVALPLFGNLFPERLSFLLSMRYYAGNWACSAWLLKGGSYRKLDKLKKASPWIYDQLDRFYDKPTGRGLGGRIVAFRLMHLHGRAMPRLLLQAVDRIDDYVYMEGELVAGMVLGWNFGDGHLHGPELLRRVQRQCGFEEGELRCVFVEPQPLFGRSLRYRIADAKTGTLQQGRLAIAALRACQPWESPQTDDEPR
jgi:hypothetical protein